MCLEGVWNVSGRCLGGVWKVSGLCLEDVKGIWIMSGRCWRCLKGVSKLSGICLGDFQGTSIRSALMRRSLLLNGSPKRNMKKMTSRKLRHFAEAPLMVSTIKKLFIIGSFNSDLQVGIWFSSVALPPIITIPISLWLSPLCLKMLSFLHKSICMQHKFLPSREILFPV